jgi:uncharacterized cysteine cluster protein YcgN (CxxCxxCC family)
MESNTIRNNIVLAIDVVALEKKTEYCHQYYETHATYCTFIERMTVENLLILPSKCVILRLKVIGSQPNVVVLLRGKHNTLSFFLMLVINESIEQVGRKKVDVILWRNKMGGRLPRVYDRKTSMKKKIVVLTQINCNTTVMQGHTLSFVEA